MVEGRVTRWMLRIASAFVLAFVYFPLVVIGLYAFNDNVTQSWPIEGWTTKWFSAAFHNEEVRDAFFLSVKAAVLATAVALVLGTCASLAVARYRFFGRETISFLVILPIALPGIVTGIALSATIDTVLEPIGINAGLFTIVVGHATFCVVVVYNNVIARLRRTGGSFEEASSDLGADSWQTFRRVTLPGLGTALLAGSLLAFGLSFDEVIVTVFTAGSDQTLPIWIFSNLARPNELPIINVVALVVVLLSIIPVYAAQKLAGGGEAEASRGVRTNVP
jgi:putative spermidine/putrescine transport system permease protein